MTADQILALEPALAEFLGEFDDCFGRSEPRQHLKHYVRGQLSNLQRKSVEPIALFNNIAPRTLQEYLNTDVWDHARARARIQQIVARDHEDPKAIGIIDDSGHPKSGKETPGVQWQYCGRLGKTANCIVTVQLAFSSFDTRFRTMLDTELFLPESWSDDRERCRAAGIPDDVVHSVFTPFFTTKEPGKGTGLGLSITYSIVESHDGQITIERPSGGGAAFRIDLPPAPADTPRPARAAQAAGSTAPAGPSGKRTILLLDADPAVQRMVKALFARDGHDVEVAGDPQHALDLAQRGGFDLILADARASAPGKRGTLFVEDLLQRVPALRDRLIVATGDVRPATEETLARLGVRYVRKPFNLRDLRDAAARLWAAGALS